MDKVQAKIEKYCSICTNPSFTHYSSYYTDGAVINCVVIVYYTVAVVNHHDDAVIMHRAAEQNISDRVVKDR